MELPPVLRSRLAVSALWTSGLGLLGLAIALIGSWQSNDLASGYGFLGVLSLSMYALIVGTALWAALGTRSLLRRIRRSKRD